MNLLPCRYRPSIPARFITREPGRLLGSAACPPCIGRIPAANQFTPTFKAHHYTHLLEAVSGVQGTPGQLLTFRIRNSELPLDPPPLMGITMFPQNKFTCSDFGFRICHLPIPADRYRCTCHQQYLLLEWDFDSIERVTMAVSCRRSRGRRRKLNGRSRAGRRRKTPSTVLVRWRWRSSARRFSSWWA